MEMTLVIKSKNVCLLYLPVISRGKLWGKRIDNTSKCYKKKREMFKTG